MVSTNATARRPTGVSPRLTMALIALALFFLLSQAVDGQVPTAGDFAACNEEAPQAVKAGTASPIMGDHVRADRARDSAMTTIGPASTGIESADPQIHGMDAEGAQNAAYQAAYRSCMRRKGF
jgi:hypothetical protein